MKVFVTRSIPETGIELLKKQGYAVTINPYDRVLTKAELIDYIKKDRYDALLPLLTDSIDSDVLDAIGPQCKIVANYAVGIDNINIAEAKKRGIIVTNTPGVLTEAVAEHTIAMLFAIADRLVEADRYMREGKYKGWGPQLLLGADIAQKTLGIIGLGRIGYEVAKRMHRGFDSKIVYYDQIRKEDAERELKATYLSLDEVLAQSDFVCICVSLTPQTKRLITAERLRMMKPTAYLINTARGAIIDEKALVLALQERRIAGAALDVFEHEPDMAPGLAELDTVVLAPHIGSATIGTRSKMSEMAAQNIIAVLHGKPPINPV